VQGDEGEERLAAKEVRETFFKTEDEGGKEDEGDNFFYYYIE
jgi:hypothetical protein